MGDELGNNWSTLIGFGAWMGGQGLGRGRSKIRRPDGWNAERTPALPT